MAAARLGDVRRARADTSAAARLDGAAAGRARSAIETELGRQRVDGAPEKLLADLGRAAGAGAPLPDLIALAVKVHKATGEQRLRYDEIYQDRLRALEDGVRASPKSADRLADWARYLIEEADNRGEKVEPRRELLLYRWQESREKELGRAIQIADRALALDPRHVEATIQKALALTALRQYDQAEALADRVLKLAGNHPDALRLYARFRATRANQLSSEAAGLRQERCSSSSHDETRSDGVYRVTTTTCYPPSRADLQRAAELDGQAAELRKRARAAMEAAIRVTKGTVEGYLIEADLHLWNGQLDAAQAALQAAVKRDPRSLEAQEQLAQFYARTGQGDRAEEQWAIARQLIHTTAAPMLRLAWARANKTAWQGARAALSSARQLDPEDARTPAYLGVVMEGDGKPREASAAFRTALALEEARLALDEPASGKVLARDALDFGLAIEMRFRLARLSEQAGNRGEALALYESAAGYQPRMARGWEARQMFTAMLPDQAPARGAVVPAPVNAATLVAEAHLGAGKLLSAMGKQDEALRHFTAAASLGPRRMAGVPMIGNSRGDTNFSGIAGAPASEAALYVARALLAKGDPHGASQALYEVGRDLPEQLRSDLNQLNLAIARESSRVRPQGTYTQSDPQAQQYAEVQRQQDQARMRTAMRRMEASARVVPEVVGTWELAPDNKFLPWQKTLTIDAAANYVLVSTRDGSTTRGR
jgi:Tfp pilus assembly protein PilF